MVGSDTVSSKPRALKGRDLITIGIFTALYFVVNFACMLVSGLHPYLWVFMPAIDALLAGIPFMLGMRQGPQVRHRPRHGHGAFPRLLCHRNVHAAHLGDDARVMASSPKSCARRRDTAASSATPLPMRSSASGCAEAPCRYGRSTTRSWRRSRLRGWVPTIWQRSKLRQRPK